MTEPTPLRVAIRVDASIYIGSGHVMRCLTLARTLREKGADVRFLHRDMPGNMGRRIQDAGFAMTLLPAPPAVDAPPEGFGCAWLGVPVETDAADTINALRDWCPDTAVDVVVADHYALATAWEMQVAPYARRLVVFDDLANKTHACDVLIDQSVYMEPTSRHDARVPKTCRVLSGARYAIIGPEYAALRQGLPIREHPVRTVFIFFGSVDETQETARVLRLFSQPEFERYSLRIVVGHINENLEAIKVAAARRGKATVESGLPSLATLMKTADLAITSCGNTIWEQLCLGLPTVLIAVSRNQINSSENVHRIGAGCYAGFTDVLSNDTLKEAIGGLCSNREHYRSMSKVALDSCDGLGADRVADAILDGLKC